MNTVPPIPTPESLSTGRPRTDELGFDGDPFDPLAAAARPAIGLVPAVVHTAHSRAGGTVRAPAVYRPDPARGALAQIRAGIVDSHRAALTAQLSVQRLILRRALGAAPRDQALTSPAAVVRPAAPEGAFKPLAVSVRRHLDRDALQHLADADVASVFGSAYVQPSANKDIGLAADRPLVLEDVTELDLRAGPLGQGGLRARFAGDPVSAAMQAAEVFVLYTGLHLCLADATLSSTVETVHAPGQLPAEGDLELVVTEIDLVPRPHLTAEVIFAGAQSGVSVTVAVTERPGSAVGPGRGGALDVWTGRMGAGGERALLSEFHMAHLARGDQATALGPEFGGCTGRRATRLPTGGLLLVDRVMRFDGRRGVLDNQVVYESEYDAPADSWYFADSANESMPHFAYMETSLQAALLMGFYLGPTLIEPDATLSLRNLGGTATVLRQVDLRDKTIHQTSRLLATTLLPGSSLQSFDYTLYVDGEPFYQGETMFGYFSDEALGNQAGLDAGQTRPTWLAQHNGHVDVREIDLTVRRSGPQSHLTSRGALALLDRIDVVDGGGEFGNGYLHAVRRIDPTDWFFSRHFYLDPVIPGSLGVETVIQAMQEWVLDSGFVDDLTNPGFVIPQSIPFTWKYRGQFLPGDGSCELEVHIKSVERRVGGVIVTADASLWKPGLRIYELLDVAVELRSQEAVA